MIKLHEVHKVYTQGKQGFHALKDINLFFEKGEFVSIFGPSGCGKTTLLNILGGLDSPTSGDMVIHDRLATEFVEKEWDYFRNHRIGFVFQQYNLIEHLPIIENVALSLKLGGQRSKNANKEAIKLLTKVGLENHLHKLPGELSGGERQRVAIARALINDPDIILADEPTGALDKKTGREVMDLIKSICSDKLVIVVTHNRKLAEEYSTRIIELKDGRVEKDSNPHDKKVKINNYRTKLRAKLKFTEALKLSFYNIKGKIWRTLLVSLGLSIGIVGLILVDALFNSIRSGLAQQEVILKDNPDMYIAEQYENNFNPTSIQTSIEGYGYFKEVLYSPEKQFMISKEVSSDAMLTSPVVSYVVESPKTTLLKDTFIKLVGDSKFPTNDNEMMLNLNTAKRLVNSNLNLTKNEIWEILEGKEYVVYSDYNFYISSYNVAEKIENGTCIETSAWNGDLSVQPQGYDVGVLGTLGDNINSLAPYRDTPVTFGETSLFCDSYDEFDWNINFSEPRGEGHLVTVVGIHENNLFNEIIMSDNLVYNTNYQLENIELSIDDASIRYRVFLNNEEIDNKASIVLEMENNGFVVRENLNSGFNFLEGITNFFMYILQFIFSSIIFIAVITGGLMLLLILLISIIERKREIGLIRAMGGTRSDVRIIYTGETTIIGFISGLMSIILGVSIIAIANVVLYNNYLDLILEYLPFVDPKHILTINIGKLAWAIFGSIIIAILSGLIPAVSASRKKPIEALRNE